MANPYGCCCCGGCNLWIDTYDNTPCTGLLGEDSDCKPLDCGEKRCGDTEPFPPSGPELFGCGCGPGLPETVSFTANTHWSFAWARKAQDLSCMGEGSPEADATHSMPADKWSCVGEPGDKQVVFWGPSLPGEESTGGWWVDAGAINMTLRMDQEIAAAVDYNHGGATDDGMWEPGCCAKYYYGKCTLSGPSTPTIDMNPFGYDADYFDGDGGTLDTAVAPTSLEAYGRLEILTGGWGPNSATADQPSSLVMRCTLTIHVILADVVDHYTEIIEANTFYWATPLALQTVHSVQVDGCSCGSGIDFTEGIDWTSPYSGSWAHKWEYPTSGQATDSITYTNSPGSCTGSPYCCGTNRGGTPWACTVETFTLKGFEGAACSASGLCSKPWAFEISDPCNPTRKKPGTSVWAYPQTAELAGGMPQPCTGFGYASTNAFGSGAGDQEGTSFFSKFASQMYYCKPNDEDGSANTQCLNGGFTASNHTIFNMMPMPALTNVVIGIGNGTLY